MKMSDSFWISNNGAAGGADGKKRAKKYNGRLLEGKDMGYSACGTFILFIDG